MRKFAIVGFAVGTVLAGCASTNDDRSRPTAAASTAPPHQHSPGDADQAGKMAKMCPMKVSGTTVAATEVDNGIGLSFTTTTGDIAELRQRVRRMAQMHNQRGDHTMMGGEMMMPPASAAAEDIEGGVQLVLQPRDSGQLGALREHVRTKARRMAGGECPMMSHDNGGESAHATPGDGEHDTHQ